MKADVFLVPVARDDFVTLLRMAADTSGQPLADGEVRLLRHLCDRADINPELAGINLGSLFKEPTKVYMPHSGVYHLVDEPDARRGVISTDNARCGAELHGGVILEIVPMTIQHDPLYQLCPVCARR